ncbi:MAG: NADH-quinone oxidoreductase subunit L [Verrucomicrobiota bacterium]|jgi:NADH-quinone oxidoreductase subunit L
MGTMVNILGLIPGLPLLAAGVSALAPRRCRRLSAGLAIGAMALAFLLSLAAFAETLQRHGEQARQVFNFPWFQFGDAWLQLGWVLDPLAAVMLVMVTFVGLVIFIYSVGYMAQDANFTRFFTFLSLFAGAMLGVVIANSLLLLFICWELVGLTSYLLIGFWFHKPSAAAAAKKAFVTTRVGDIALLLGMVWLYAKTGTLLFYDHGQGCLEAPVLAKAFPIDEFGDLPLLGIALLIFVGAMGKSGQVPLHVWLPDAMEGPTPVSALIHAATMVAAGVFLVARVFALMKPNWAAFVGPHAWVSLPPPDATLVITWVGAITAVFAALIAVAQTDIKRILAYSTVSQLGYMMLGLGVGGVAVGMFHLITHAFFKALLFLGAGSVIHGVHEEQDIRRMGGLRRFMPVTFATYAIGMLALAGFPLLFSGFWSKDEILHAAHSWPVSRWPFYLGLFGALLTAFYMTRQVCCVFFGNQRAPVAEAETVQADKAQAPHESPKVMTVPLLLLAAGAILLGFVGTPAWPWFQSFLEGESPALDWGRLVAGGTLGLMVVSSLVVFTGLGLGWWLYGRRPRRSATDADALERLMPEVFGVLRGKFFVDELYEATVIRWHAAWAQCCDLLDRWVWGGLVLGAQFGTLGLSWLSKLCDDWVVNLGFDRSCDGIQRSARFTCALQDGQVHNYLRALALAFAVLVLLLTWACAG